MLWDSAEYVTVDTKPEKAQKKDYQVSNIFPKTCQDSNPRWYKYWRIYVPRWPDEAITFQTRLFKIELEFPINF